MKLTHALNLADLTTEQLFLISHEVESLLSCVFKAAAPDTSRRIEAIIAVEVKNAWTAKALRAVDLNIGVGDAVTFLNRMDASLKDPLTKEQWDVVRGRLRSIYKISQREIASNLKKPIEYTVADEKIVSNVLNAMRLFVNNLYRDRVSNVFRKVIAENGLSRDRLLAVVKATKKSSANDDPNLAMLQIVAVTAHQVRTFARLAAMKQVGVITYRLVNPDDERTTEICQHLNGQVFNVDLGLIYADRLGRATTTDQLREVQPVIPPQELEVALQGLAPGSVDAANVLDVLGGVVPPFHPFCRTDVVIESFER
jgi:hypothetical protein